MANLDAQQIAVLVAESGWFPNKPKSATYPGAVAMTNTAVAIAMAESSGNPNAVNGSHYGLYQIGKDSHPDLFVSHKWNDPKDNVAMAKIVYQRAGNSFSPWDASKATWSKAAPSVIPKSDAPNSARADALKAVKGPADVVAGALKDTFKWLASGALVIGASLLAIVLLGVGIWLIVSNTKTGKQLGQAAKDAGEHAAMAAAL